MKNLFLFALLVPFSLLGQSDPVQLVINDQVWKPFIRTYSEFDAAGFMEIHTDDVLRIIRDGQIIKKREQYEADTRKGSERSSEQDQKRSIELRFLERFAVDDVAFEVGYYKATFQIPGQPEQVFYGKFHVILKQAEGKWKIFVDSDTSLDNSITEQEFLTAKGLVE